MHITAVKTPSLKLCGFLPHCPHEENAETFPKQVGMKTKENEYKKAAVSSAERFTVCSIAVCFAIWYGLLMSWSKVKGELSFKEV